MMFSSTNMFAVVFVTVLVLLPVGLSASLTCEDLLRPLDQPDLHHMVGRWDLVAGSFSDPAHLEFFKFRNSSNIYISNATSSSDITYTTVVHMGGKCHYGTYNVTLKGSTIVFDVRHQIKTTLTLICTSCADCVVMRFDNGSKKAERLWLFSKRREVDPKELEEFRSQVECLNMLPPVVMDPNNEICKELGTEKHQEA
ncbi:unnamed protein product [Menidia menidia]|uniref:(Atlantic silverside) hypothetical protein n=1 Tax=Menidia menidia TaxID=238744 RepID=A0A8S4BCL5_9TELE|nr:unnamed protein product [Menidia menidia]CAG5941965.1 unnamed protein product [Menidia menidia]